MRESWGRTKPRGAVKVKAVLVRPRWDLVAAAARSRERRARAHHRPVPMPSRRGRSESVHVGTRKMVNYGWSG